MNKRFKAAYLTVLTVGMLANMSVVMAEGSWLTRWRTTLIGGVSGLVAGSAYMMGYGLRSNVVLAGGAGLFYALYAGWNANCVNNVEREINNEDAKQMKDKSKPQIKESEFDPISEPKQFVNDKPSRQPQQQPTNNKKPKLPLDELFKVLEQANNYLKTIKNIVGSKKQAYKDKVDELQKKLGEVLWGSRFVSRLNNVQSTTLEKFRTNANNNNSNNSIVENVFKVFDKSKKDFERDRDHSFFSLIMPNVKKATPLYLKLRKLSVALDFC